MISLAHRARGTVTVITPSGSRLRIPPWMLEPEAADPKILPQALLSAHALLGLAEFVRTSHLSGGILQPGLSSGKEESVAPASIARGRTAWSGRTANDRRVASRAGGDDGSGNPISVPRQRRTR